MAQNIVPKHRVLPPKDASNFRSALKLYEQKQYKKALKTAEGVLKKHPEHGETLAVKGLVLYFMGKKDEARGIVSGAVEKDPTSYVCWHINGICLRQDRKWDEALKAYTKALQLDPENQNILRDLSLLQTQTRQFAQMVSSRARLLKDKPGFRANWSSLAIAHHLAGDNAAADRTLSSFEELLKEPLPKTDAENTEVIVFHNRVVYNAYGPEKALEHLENKVNGKTMDELAVLEYRAQYLLELERYKEAEKEIRALIKRNPDCYEYYERLEKALQVDSSNLTLRKALYDRLSQKYPKSDVPKYLPLKFLSGEPFAKAAEKYLREKLVRGVPSAFVLVKPLYRDAEKANAIVKVVTSLLEELEKQDRPDPSAVVWTLHFLAQHYTFVGELEKALDYVNKAIEHTPTLVEPIMAKARILKHVGDFEGAAQVMDSARELDLQDRFVNTKTVKYQLRAGKMEKAISTLSLFTRNDSNGRGVQDLHDMQAMWFLNEQAEAYARAHNRGLALKRFEAAIKTIDDFDADQWDFHVYCPRKGTLRAYIDMIKWADKLYSDPGYVRAAAGAINLYVQIFDERQYEERLLESSEGANGDSDGKKASKKKKKQNSEGAAKEAALDAKPDDEDPQGRGLVGTKDPIGDAFALWKPMGDSSVNVSNPTVWKLGFELYLRQAKYVLAIQALVKAKAAGVPHSWLVGAAVRVRHVLETDTTTPPALRALPLKMLPSIVPDTDIGASPCPDLVQVLDKHALDGTVGGAVDWAYSRVAINKPQSIDKELEKAMGAVQAGDYSSLDRAFEALDIVRMPQAQQSEQAIADLSKACAKAFPLATIF